MTERVIEQAEIGGLLTKLTGTFVGALRDDKSIIKLIVCEDGGFNVNIKHPSVDFDNNEGVYLFSQPVGEGLAKAKYYLLTHKLEQMENERRF